MDSSLTVVGAKHVVTACFLFAVMSAWSAQAATLPVLRIDMDKVTARVSPLHSGLMTEEINHSFDGGLYAELIRDRALNGNIMPKAGSLGAWMLIGGGNGRAGLALDVSNALSDAIPVSLRIDAMSASARHRVGVANGGFWGIPVRPNTPVSIVVLWKSGG